MRISDWSSDVCSSDLFRVLQIIRDSGGAAVAVSEADTAAELSRVWRDTRWWISPEGAACLAALPQLLDRGLLKAGERVVAVNTGALEKYQTNAGPLLESSAAVFRHPPGAVPVN